MARAQRGVAVCSLGAAGIAAGSALGLALVVGGPAAASPAPRAAASTAPLNSVSGASSSSSEPVSSSAATTPAPTRTAPTTSVVPTRTSARATYAPTSRARTTSTRAVVPTAADTVSPDLSFQEDPTSPSSVVPDTATTAAAITTLDQGSAGRHYEHLFAIVVALALLGLVAGATGLVLTRSGRGAHR